ncbi:MAG: hypothetical protein ACR2LV_07765 [Solirubrobacteraceae bacterium]
MASRKKKLKAAVPFSTADVANLTKSNPYVQRLIEDPDLRANLQKAMDASKSAYERLADGKNPAKSLMDDKKLQNDLRNAVESIRDATTALADAPKKRRRGRAAGRLLLVAGVGGGVGLVANEKLRSKVLDKLFGAEEEFQYTPAAAAAGSAAAPVGTA